MNMKPEFIGICIAVILMLISGFSVDTCALGATLGVLIILFVRGMHGSS